MLISDVQFVVAAYLVTRRESNDKPRMMAHQHNVRKLFQISISAFSNILKLWFGSLMENFQLWDIFLFPHLVTSKTDGMWKMGCNYRIFYLWRQNHFLVLSTLSSCHFIYTHEYHSICSRHISQTPLGHLNKTKFTSLHWLYVWMDKITGKGK